MASLEREEVLTSLVAKGFRREERDHIYLLLEVDGRKTGIVTKVSRGTKYKTLGDDLVTVMRKQVQLDTTKQFLDLVHCPMDHESYVAYLRSKGLQV